MTHKAKVLARLSDGFWHSHLDLYDLHVIAHSRIADLRADGYTIECDKRDGNYWYRMVGRPDKSGVGLPNPSSPGRLDPPENDGSSRSTASDGRGEPHAGTTIRTPEQAGTRVSRCCYCGTPIDRKSTTCRNHVDLLRLDAELTGWTPKAKEAE